MNRSLGAQRGGKVVQPRFETARAARLPATLPVLAAAALLLLGVALRAPTALYSGPPEQKAFNSFIFGYLGAYSDVASLYFRDGLWRHPIPYADYQLEYPVGMGLLIWLIGFANGNVTVYLLATAAVMAACGLAVVWLVQRFRGANVWLLALSPTLPLYVVLNWDWASILLTVAALLMLQRRQDGWGGVLLAAAVWTKFFPIVLVPLVLLDRGLRRRWRDAAVFSGAFAVASVIINAPVALQRGPAGWQLRDSWLYFFRFNQQRGSEVNFWTLFRGWGLSLEQINLFSTLLLGGGVAAIMLLMWRRWDRGDARAADLILPASLAAVAWFFLINKVYSPQYSLWLVVLMALLASPPALVVAFAGIDLLYFGASFVMLYLSSQELPAASWFFDQALLPAMVLRELVIAVIVGWALWRLVQTPPANGVVGLDTSKRF